MLFSSFTFLFQFLPATLLAFAAARRHSPRAGILVLVGAVADVLWRLKPIYLLLFLTSIGCNFGLGLLMTDPTRRRVFGALGVTLNLAALCYFKYAGFLLDSVSMFSGVPMPLTNIILPLGISFFTFQQIAYLVDVMRGAKVERDIVSYTLFVSFFPHLIAGPLVHHAEMIPQFKRAGSTRTASMAARGVAIFVAGLFKKIVIADNIAQFVSPVFAHVDGGGSVATAWAWLATLGYTLQIYFDFSGYSDMALGLGLLFGIRLPVNFRSPYRATSIIEFWRRWHITLSRFLRDYLYIPLGGNRQGEARRYINLLLTMLLGGLWHGAGWNFVVWGGLHGLYLCINHIWRGGREVAHSGAVTLAKVAGWAATFVAVVIAWVFFRAGTIAGAWQMLRGSVRSYERCTGLCIAWYSARDGFTNSAGLRKIAPCRSYRCCDRDVDRDFLAERPANLSLSRVSPGTGARCIPALASQCRVGDTCRRRFRDRAVRDVAALGIPVLPVLNAACSHGLPNSGDGFISFVSIARTQGRVCMKSIYLLSAFTGSMRASEFYRSH